MDLILILVIVIIPLIAQARINSTYNKYSEINNSVNMTGREVAKKILEKNGISYVKINKTYGRLSDHYNPKTKMVNLSEDIYEGNSIAAISVAAHECGHAIQDKEAYSFLRFRSAMVPVVNFTSRISTILLFISIILGFLDLLYIAAILMIGSLAFQFITLPVEYNASARAKKQLEELGFAEKKDKKGIEKVLGAAALTYVASFLATAANVLRLLLISRNRR